MVAVEGFTGYFMYVENSDKGCRIISYKQNKKEGREIKIREHPDKSGYQCWVVYLINDEGKKKQLVVARLLVQHFKPEEWDETLQVDHIDRDSLNNRLDNLRMVTNQENQQNRSPEPQKNNKSSGHKYITPHHDGWKFRKQLNTLSYYKSFKLLEEAVEFKKNFLVIHNCH